MIGLKIKKKQCDAEKLKYLEVVEPMTSNNIMTDKKVFPVSQS